MTAAVRAGWLLLALLSVAIGLASLRYLGGDPSVAPAELRASAAANMPLFIAHAAGAALALLLLPFQLLTAGKPRWREVHRWLGRLYVAGVTLGGIAALPLALQTYAGPLAAAGFASLGIVWLWSTWAGVIAARQGRLQDHRAWMVRSAALTGAAITLRLYLPLPPLVGIDYDSGYRAIAWACWVPNLVLAELWLRRRSPAIGRRPSLVPQ